MNRPEKCGECDLPLKGPMSCHGHPAQPERGKPHPIDGWHEASSNLKEAAKPVEGWEAKLLAMGQGVHIKGEHTIRDFPENPSRLYLDGWLISFIRKLLASAKAEWWRGVMEAVEKEQLAENLTNDSDIGYRNGIDDALAAIREHLNPMK